MGETWKRPTVVAAATTHFTPKIDSHLPFLVESGLLRGFQEWCELFCMNKWKMVGASRRGSGSLKGTHRSVKVPLPAIYRTERKTVLRRICVGSSSGSREEIIRQTMHRMRISQLCEHFAERPFALRCTEGILAKCGDLWDNLGY